jgi:transposase
MKRMMEVLMSHSYVAFVTAATLIAETSGFVLFKNARQLTCYSGLDIVLHDSGKSVSKPGKISKQGNAYIRRVMFLCARSIKNSHPEYSKMTKRIMMGTKYKDKATVAVARKILTVLFAMVKQDREYEANYDWQKEQKARLEKERANLKKVQQTEELEVLIVAE